MASNTTVTKYEYWFRIGTLLFEGIHPALLFVLHNLGNDPSYQGLPSHPADLFNELDNNHKSKLQNLQRRRRIISQEQCDLLISVILKF